MVSKGTFTYLADWLCESMRKAYAAMPSTSTKERTLEKYGLTDKIPYDARKKMLRQIVEGVICGGNDRNLLADSTSGVLYAFNGRYYEPLWGKAEDFLGQLILRAFRRLKIGEYYCQGFPDTIGRACLKTLTCSDEYAYEPNKRYIAFENGVLDLKDGKLKKFDQRYCPAIVMDFEYKSKDQCYKDAETKYGHAITGDNPNPCRLWERKVGGFGKTDCDYDDCIIPNGEMREAFQMFCGGLLLDRHVYKFEYMCILKGTGANGKSVLVDAISGVFDRSRIGHFSPQQLFRSQQRQSNMAALAGKLVNIAGDLDKDDFSGGDLKRFISGEVMEANRKFCDPMQMEPPLILGCTNHDPISTDKSWGHYRRFLLLYTTQRQFSEDKCDTMLTYKLSSKDARQYIFAWIYDGYRKLIKKNGVIELSATAKGAIEQMMYNDSPTLQWLKYVGYEPCEPTDARGQWKSYAELYREYSGYCETFGETREIAREVNKNLRDIGFAERRRQDGCGVFIRKTDINED